MTAAVSFALDRITITFGDGQVVVLDNAEALGLGAELLSAGAANRRFVRRVGAPQQRLAARQPTIHRNKSSAA
jgi:hypothetical protein